MERCVIQQKMRADGSPSNTKNPRFGAVARVRRAARENIQMLPMGSDIYRERSPRAREAMLRFWQYKKLKKKKAEFSNKAFGFYLISKKDISFKTFKFIS